jgi:DNA-binding FadR family transcriptional regulator
MTKPSSRSALLARELLGRIARRELRAGDPIDLPALGRQHGVSRTVVREALADLGGKGLVVARPKVGTAIAPETQWNLLDPVLVGVAIAETGPDSMLAEATELRRVIEPAIAASAARDASRVQRGAVLDAVRALADAVGAGDRERWRTADAMLHAAIGQACANRLLRSIDHSLVPVRALYRHRLAAAQLAGDGPGPDIRRLLGLQASLGTAIARGDADRAADRALELAMIAPAAVPGIADTVPERSETVPSPDSAPFAAAIGADAADAAVDWPDTEILVRPADGFAPVRRGRLDADEPAMAVRVPALTADGRRGQAPFTVAR